MKPTVTFLGGCAHGFRCEDPETKQWVAYEFPPPPSPPPPSPLAAVEYEVKSDIYERRIIITDGERLCAYVLAGMQLIDALRRAFRDCHTHNSLK